MTPIRALFFLAAITAACAGRIPTKVQDTHANSLETHIALLASHRLTGNPIENGIEKFKELVRKIKERIQEAENELIDALQASSSAVVKKINEFILKKTGVDLKLDERLEALEKKTEACTSQFQGNLKEVILEIKTSTETCAANQVTDTKDIGEKILVLVDILKVVPSKTIANIKACNAAPTTPAPPTEPTTEPATEEPITEPATEEPITETAEPITEPAEPITEPAEPITEPAEPITEPAEPAEPVTEPAEPITEPAEPITEPAAPEGSGDSDNTDVALRGHRRHSLGSWSDLWRKTKCVAKVLDTAARELAEVPTLVETLYSDIADLTSKASREKLEKCAAEAVAGKASLVQEAAAQLAYCVIAPSKQ